MTNHVEPYIVNSQIKFKMSMLSLSLCGYRDTYILVSETITIPNTAADRAAANNRNNIIIRNCGPVTNCISEINIIQIDNAKNIDIVMSMYNLIEYSYKII